MTKEQIAELGRGAQLHRPSSDSPATAGELLRLLEEREKLLGFAGEVADGCECSNHADEAREAIAFAEAPAD